jgi:hypothetical protein
MADKPQLTKEQVERLKPLLKARIPINEGPGCFLCKWIFEDLESSGNLTGKREFPESGKYQHLMLEGMIE